MNKYVYGFVLACALLSLPSVNCAAQIEQGYSQEDSAERKAAYIAKCKAEGAEKTEARRIAREAKEVAQKAKEAAELEAQVKKAGSE